MTPVVTNIVVSATETTTVEFSGNITAAIEVSELDEQPDICARENPDSNDDEIEDLYAEVYPDDCPKSVNIDTKLMEVLFNHIMLPFMDRERSGLHSLRTFRVNLSEDGGALSASIVDGVAAAATISSDGSSSSNVEESRGDGGPPAQAPTKTNRRRINQKRHCINNQLPPLNRSMIQGERYVPCFNCLSNRTIVNANDD